MVQYLHFRILEFRLTLCHVLSLQCKTQSSACCHIGALTSTQVASGSCSSRYRYPWQTCCKNQRPLMQRWSSWGCRTKTCPQSLKRCPLAMNQSGMDRHERTTGTEQNQFVRVCLSPNLWSVPKVILAEMTLHLFGHFCTMSATQGHNVVACHC